MFIYPVIKVVMTSVWLNGQFSLVNYKALFATPIYTQVLLKTLWISVVSTVITLIIGYALANFIAKRPSKQQGFWLMIVVASMFMSLTVRLFGWMIVLGEQGPVIKLIHLMFGASVDLQLMFTPTAVIIGIVHFVLPFVVLNIYTTIKRIEPALPEASIMLGASGFCTFWRVVFPLSLPGVYAGASLAFSLAASTFLVPTVLGGPKDSLMSNIAYNSTITVGNMGMGSAISFVLLLIIVMVLMVINALERRGQHVN
jgi:ABC-type spermidine/putrescine transport system permease subunit I